MVPIGRMDACGRFDNDGAIHAFLLLEIRVRVVPVGPTLSDRKFIGKGGPGTNRRKIDVGNAVHIGGHEHSVPVNGGLYLHLIMDTDSCDIALFKAQSGSRNSAVDGHAPGLFAGEIHELGLDDKVALDDFPPCCRI